jgi:nucleoside-diphosphate-sugar epimerase
MKVFVSGSSGHLGEALCITLAEQDIEYVSIDINPGTYTTHVGSITNVGLINELMQGVDIVFHAATLHKPHVATHSKQAFIDTNISGTLNLLEASIRAGVKGFIFTSTTSTFGDSLKPQPGEPAAWVTEDTPVLPKNIYGVSKTTAEDLCQLFHRNFNLPVIILRTSRFFLEIDDNELIRDKYEDLNIKANEFTHRRVDIQDVVDAHLLALNKLDELKFKKYIISATSAFTTDMLDVLHSDAPAVVQELYPDFKEIYAARGWHMFPAIGRVYVNLKAINELGWKPKYDFAHVLSCLSRGEDFFSPLARKIGIKYYHSKRFKDGPYPV